ncbi:PAS domain-containing protein [Methylobacterium mesophilicum]|uniref:PAS domain-containing protein n=1 Tax=Methylobacterium mesophilicum TaxID=39956 RepID=UPI001FCE4FD5|nr:PAS domain-containing protein [Methylobacterium mesophilicum]
MASLSIGVWEADLEADRTRGDVVMARLFGLSEEEAAEGVTIARLLSAFHPDDLMRDMERRRLVLEQGGVFVWEHRVVPAPGIVRWVLARGHYARDPRGRMFGRGIVIDVTDSRNDGHTDGPARFLTTPEHPGSNLERMTERALEIERIIRDLDVQAAKALRPLIEPLLRELGRQIAASLAESSMLAEPVPDLTVH